MSDDQDEKMMQHLRHMERVRPAGLDRSAAVWAMGEIGHLRLLLRIATDKLSAAQGTEKGTTREV